MTFVRYIIVILIVVANLFQTDIDAEKNYNRPEAFQVSLYMWKLTFESNEPVLLHINIKNSSGKKNSFKIYDVDYTTFKPIVYDMNGKEIETKISYRLKNWKINDVLRKIKPRNIILAENESFTHTVDLRQLYKITSTNEYRVKLFFSPDAGKAIYISGVNMLTLKILKTVDKVNKNSIARIDRYLSPERKLSPGEIVHLFLMAEKESDWNNFFKYIKIDNYIDAYPDYVRIYNIAKDNNDIEKKEKIIHDFVNFLKKQRNDYIIDFKILDQFKMNQNDIYVDVLVKRFGSLNPFLYKYRYTLEEYENFWIITDVEASVVKGQKI